MVRMSLLSKRKANQWIHCTITYRCLQDQYLDSILQVESRYSKTFLLDVSGQAIASGNSATTYVSTGDRKFSLPYSFLLPRLLWHLILLFWTRRASFSCHSKYLTLWLPSSSCLKPSSRSLHLGSFGTGSTATLRIRGTFWISLFCLPRSWTWSCLWALWGPWQRFGWRVLSESCGQCE